MIIQRNLIDIPELTIAVLEACPSNQRDEFVKGYISFVDRFFGDLKYGCRSFTDKDGQFDVDLNDAIEFSLQSIEQQMALLPMEQRQVYWNGVNKGIERSLQILIMVFETEFKIAS